MQATGKIMNKTDSHLCWFLVLARISFIGKFTGQGIFKTFCVFTL